MGPRTMNREQEDRILALKSNTSQNPPTSVVPRGSMLNNSDNGNENDLQQRTKDHNSVSFYNDQTFVWASSFQDDKEGKDTERVHWEPPTKLTMRQE